MTSASMISSGVISPTSRSISREEKKIGTFHFAPKQFSVAEHGPNFAKWSTALILPSGAWP
jgi:hypothetical protein